MILGIGIDLVEIARMEAMFQKHAERALHRIFTPGEAQRCQGAGQPMESFAARFAAKEALLKALGTGWSGGMKWTEVEVVSAESGAPTLRLHGAVLRHAESLGVTRTHLSLTHTGTTAGAIVVLEGSPNG